MKNIKRFLIMLSVFAVFASVAVFPSGAAEGPLEKWIDILWGTISDQGVHFKLNELIKDVPNADQGFYEFVFIIRDTGKTATGNDYKIRTATINGDDITPNIPWLNNGSKDRGNASDNMIIRSYYTDTDGNGFPDSGKIPASVITEAAAAGQVLQFCTNNRTGPFIIKSITATHYMNENDSEGTVIYDMFTDKTVQAYSSHAAFDGGEKGLMHNRNATYRIIEGERHLPASTASPDPNPDGVADKPDTAPVTDPGSNGNGGETPPSSGENKTTTETPTNNGSTSPLFLGLIAATALAVLGASGGAFLLSKG
ncbi:MAG: hypothetical protein FWG44_05200 [Oscillospiraceae bacterium]|nr:hypothetical protein [Oscillospiraceae bacterium]